MQCSNFHGLFKGTSSDPFMAWSWVGSIDAKLLGSDPADKPSFTDISMNVDKLLQWNPPSLIAHKSW
jgi:hypothetical protein